jgi:GT2 family glycosyltransferase
MSKHKQPRVKYDVDIVYPIYGQYQILGQSIENLKVACQNYKYRLYLTDDKAKEYDTHGLAFHKELKEREPNSIVTIHKKNEGFAKSVNDSAKLGDSKYILIINTDVILLDNAIDNMVKLLELNQSVGIVTPKLMFFPSGNDPMRPAGKIQHVGIMFDSFGNPHHAYSGWDSNHPMVNRIMDVNATSGACIMIRRDLWNKIGGFNPIYGKGAVEDLELSFECLLRGYRIVYLPHAQGYHFTNLSVLSAGETFPMQQNMMFFRSKYENKIPYDEYIRMSPKHPTELEFK